MAMELAVDVKGPGPIDHAVVMEHIADFEDTCGNVIYLVQAKC